MNANVLTPPPHSIEAEQSVLGGLMLDAKAFDWIAGQIADNDFYRDDHRRIFRHVTRLFDSGKPIDVITVAEAIDCAGETEHTGGLAYLGELVQNTPSAANIKRYAAIVKDKAMLRQMQAVAMTLADACANPSGRSVEEIAAAAEAEMQECLDRSDSEPQALADVIADAISYVDERCQRGGGLAGLATGISEQDRLTGGLEGGQLVIVAARPSSGKTALAGNVADHVASNGGTVLFHTLEMGAREVGLRLLASRSKVPVHTMRTGTNDPEHWKRMSAQLGYAQKQRLFICDKGAIGVPFVRAKARQIKRQHGLSLIVIDYLQLMTAPGHSNRTQEIGSISRGLKALAKELQVPIIALAQLNRAVEGRTDKRPLMSDLRDSGEVEQDADVIVMLHRESLYNDAPEWKNVAELLIRKNRNGPTGDITLTYTPEEMTFSPFAGPSPRHQAKSAGYPPRNRNGNRGFDDA